jgi:hypothetical protein
VLTGAFNTIIPQVRRLTASHEERARAAAGGPRRCVIED